MIEALLSNDGLLLHKTLLPQCLSFSPDIIDQKDTDNGVFTEVCFVHITIKQFSIFFNICHLYRAFGKMCRVKTSSCHYTTPI